MLIYTGDTGDPKKKDKITNLNMGIMISSSNATNIHKFQKSVPVALDNGAFSAWLKGYGFDEYLFLKTLSRCMKAGLSLNFIVCPDIVAGGIASVEFSEMWRVRLAGHKLYFAVQDGMDELDVPIKNYSGVFVGGTMDFKLKTGHRWVEFAHDNGLPCHIGRCGTMKNLQWAKSIGADSCDSTSFVRNDTFEIVEDYELQQGFLNP